MPALLIKNGRVIDPAAGLDAAADVLLVDGMVAAVLTAARRRRATTAAAAASNSRRRLLRRLAQSSERAVPALVAQTGHRPALARQPRS